MLFASVAFVLLCGVDAAVRLPEENMTVPEIISFWGYPVEVHTVTTDDGYILTMHRIPYGKGGSKSGNRPVIYMQHGLQASSSNFVANLPNQSFAFIAADKGFDVWLGNFRGNLYSLGHKTLRSDRDKSFWAFSWDQMAKYDLAAMTNKALSVSGASQLYYVGHSQGTLTMFSKLGSDAAFNKKIKKFFALAPIAQVGNTQGLFGLGLRGFRLPMEISYALTGDGQILNENIPFNELAQLYCSRNVPEITCIVFLNMLGGITTQMNETRLRVYLAEMPAGTSIMNVLHWMQIVRSGKQQMYDWGKNTTNLQKYGQITPPIYDISTVTSDVHLYWSKEDLIAVPQDVQEGLIARLKPAVIKGNVQLKSFNHFDYVWGTRAANELYAPIISTVLADFSG